MGLMNLIFLAEEGESLGDTMSRAGLNTAMGIGIVFLALAFISIIIALQGKIFTSIDKKKAAKTAAKVAEAPKTEVSAPVEIAPDDDEELVAVLTAAIYAYEAAAGGDVPADGLVVRSIRRRR